MPVAILVVVAVTQVLNARGKAQDANEQAELALAAEGPGSLFDALQNERTATYLALIGLPKEELNFPMELDETRVATNEAVSEFEGLLDDKGNWIQDTYSQAMEDLSTLGEVRGKVDTYSGPRNYGPDDFAIADEVFFDDYSAIIKRLTDANIEVSNAIADPDLRVGAELVRLSSRQGDLVAQIYMYLIASLPSPEILTSQMVDIAALQGELETNEVTVRSLATGPYRSFAKVLEEGDEIESLSEVVQTALESGEYNVEAANEQAADDDGDPLEWSHSRFRTGVAEELQEHADGLKADTLWRQSLYLFMALLAVAVAGVATWWVSRSITRPLRSLTHQATAMAGARLPAAVQQVLETPLGQDVVVPKVAPITVQTNDEVADVAQALNTVQDSALNLAVEQAVLRRNIADSFVNLGRRNQALLSRQLDFITGLEHNEANPDALANLFQLDHLATRMRRNAESLLVLGGAEPPRKWGAPVPLIDVIRAALGEVEGYQRVTVHDLGPVAMVGATAADLAHLLAELIENALVFSPPTQPVEIHGRNQPITAPGSDPQTNGPAAAVGYALEIVDSGMGMHPDEVAQANRRLVGAESFTVAPSKYLGHYVAGIIAARHGITVELRSGTGSGITAMVVLPPALLSTSQREISPGPAPTQLANPERQGWSMQNNNALRPELGPA